jgi:hypothetical protein
MAIEKGKRGDISPGVYNSAYKELVGLVKMIPKNGSVELKEIIDRSHKVLGSIIDEFPNTTVIDLGGQPVLNIIGVDSPKKKADR